MYGGDGLFNSADWAGVNGAQPAKIPRVKNKKNMQKGNFTIRRSFKNELKSLSY